MTLRGALIFGIEKGRGQEALARSLTPRTPTLEEEAPMMSVSGYLPDSAHARNENACRTLKGDAQAIRRFLEGDGWMTPDTYCRCFAPIPSEPAVYLFTVIDMETFRRGMVAYVGMSTNLLNRIKTHNILPLLDQPNIHTMRWFKKVPRPELRATESRYIRAFDPPWNINGKARGVALHG